MTAEGDRANHATSPQRMLRMSVLREQFDALQVGSRGRLGRRCGALSLAGASGLKYGAHATARGRGKGMVEACIH